MLYVMSHLSQLVFFIVKHLKSYHLSTSHHHFSSIFSFGCCCIIYLNTKVHIYKQYIHRAQCRISFSVTFLPTQIIMTMKYTQSFQIITNAVPCRKRISSKIQYIKLIERKNTIKRHKISKKNCL